ncbi:MAG: T9SS type A sorting domain-containing protein [Bacteroidales bacterium]|nr:T9SS type A sorting domain-containing protein [Bacteroidales bacterium]
MSGQKLKETKTSSKDIEIDITELESGIYMIKLTDKNGTYLQKLIKQ